MQKLIGSILVLTATAGAGYLYGEGLKDYLRQMEYLRYIAGMIRGQLEYTGAPLQELLMDVSAKIKEPYKSWLEHTARRTAKRTDADFKIEESGMGRNRTLKAFLYHNRGR